MAVLTEEQTMLQDQARAWVTNNASVSEFRKMRDAQTENGFLPETWSSIAELGWTGILVPEQYGGSGMDLITLGIVLEETGRALTASPLLSTALIGTYALLRSGNEALKQSWLPKIAQGNTVIALAVDEGAHHAPTKTNLKAEKASDGYSLSGTKTFVVDGGAAEALIVAARTSGSSGQTNGITLFFVETEKTGISRTPLKTVDSRGYANISFDQVKVTSESIIGELDQGYDILEHILDRARAGLASEMLGTATQAFDMTLEYLKTRVQFGKPIGSFQALGHRAANLYTEMQLARSCVEAALEAIDRGANDIPQLCSLAKFKIGEFIHKMSNEMIQIHGGIGMTDDFDAGFYLKRARAVEALYGSNAYHQNRYASFLEI